MTREETRNQRTLAFTAFEQAKAASNALDTLRLMADKPQGDEVIAIWGSGSDAHTEEPNIILRGEDLSRNVLDELLSILREHFDILLRSKQRAAAKYMTAVVNGGDAPPADVPAQGPTDSRQGGLVAAGAPRRVADIDVDGAQLRAQPFLEEG